MNHSFSRSRATCVRLTILALSLFGARAAGAQTVDASLLTTTEGSIQQWTPSSGTLHAGMVSANCNTANFVSTTTNGARESFRVSLYLVPPGATITAIEITPCASTRSGGSSTMSVFYRVSGTSSADQGSYALSGTTPTVLGATTFSNLSINRTTSITLEGGVVLTGGTGGAKLSGLTMRVTYVPAPPLLPPASMTTSYSGRNVTLSWVDVNTTEEGYRVERSRSPTGDFLEIGTTGANATSFLDRELVLDQTYYYRARSSQTTTGQTSGYSSVVRATLYSRAPDAPRNLAATPSGASVALSWLDASGNEDGFSIERSEDGYTYAELGTVGVGVTSFTDAAPPSGAWFYRVRAFNVLGYSAYSAPYSNVALPTAGPDLRLSVRASHASTPGVQFTYFDVDYENPGTTAAPNVTLRTSVPAGGTFSPAASSADWRCHTPTADYFILLANIGKGLRTMRARYPNLKQLFLTNQMYSGFPTAAGVLEPYGYESAFAIRAVILAQIRQIRTGVIDPIIGDLDYRTGVAPWLAWGLYDWSNGATPNGQGLQWDITKFGSDLSHPSPTGEVMGGAYMLNYFLSAPFTQWFRVQTVPAYPILPIPDPRPSPVALIDMLSNERYLGMPGGLYENGSNEIPADHLAAGVALGASIQPLDTTGAPAANGKVVLVGAGYSNSLMVFRGMITQALTDPRVRTVDRYGARTSFGLINGCSGGAVASNWGNPADNAYNIVLTQLGGYGYTEPQVQAIWWNPSNSTPRSTTLSLASTAEGTACSLSLGTVAPGQRGTVRFGLRTTLTAARSFDFSVTGFDDGSAGPDMDARNNTASASRTISICANGAGCDFCATTPAPTCDDGDPCNGTETCEPSVGCVIGPAPSCDDTNACTADSCVPRVGCTHTPVADGTSCGAGDVCNGGGAYCAAGACVKGVALQCDDGDACNGAETCDAATGCHAGAPLACDDGNVCNGVETCDPVKGCAAGTPLACDDGNVCNGVETCDPVRGCVAGAPLACDDGNACNGVETCDAVLGCVAGTGPSCDDGDPCNGVETCDPAGACLPGTPVACGATTVAPGALFFTAIAASAPPAVQTFNVRNSGRGASMPWTASSDASWLSVSPASGTASTLGGDTASVAVDPAGLGPGSYAGTITVRSDASTSGPVALAVSLTVIPAPQVVVTPTALSFSGVAGGTALAQTVSVTNGTQGTLAYSASSSAAWLAVSPASGVAPGTITVTPSLAGLAAGTYSGTVTITAPGATGSPLAIPVTLTVTAAPVEVLANGGFEGNTTTPWSRGGNGVTYVGAATGQQRSGSGYVYFSTTTGASGLVGQVVTLPSNVRSLTLSFWAAVSTTETAAYQADKLNVKIQNSAGVTLATLAVLSNLDAAAYASYTRFSYDVTAYAGQQVRIVFEGVANATAPTTFRLDDVSLLSQQ